MDTSKHIRRILKAEHGKPFEFLGPHADKRKILVRAFLPEAKVAFIVREHMSGAQPEEVLSMQ